MQSINNRFMTAKKQIGMTLIEVLAALALGGLLIAGALSLYGSGSSSNTSNQMFKDLIAVRASAQQVYMGQGGYGTASLNTVLNTSSKIPTTMTFAGGVITTSLGGTLDITGNTSNLKMVLTNVPADICTTLLSQAGQGWSSVQVGTSTAITVFPVTPAIATANAQCGGTAPFTITWTTIN